MISVSFCIKIIMYSYVHNQTIYAQGTEDCRVLKRTVLITHTGSDLPLDEAEKLGITVIPDRVLFDGEEFRNMTEITAEAFYEKMSSSENLPTSSQPSMGDFVKAYRGAAGQEGTGEILVLMITSKMSGCFRAAETAAQMVKRQNLHTPIYVYDTKQCSHGMAQMVRAASEMAERGMGAEGIMAELNRLQPRMGVYFVLRSLENARKAGRVGTVKAAAADMLGLRPVLQFADGLVNQWGTARNFDAGLEAVAERFAQEGDWSKPVTVFHGGAPEQAELLKEKILASVPEAQIRMETVGPVIGIYAGAGCAGAAFTKRDIL